MTAGPAIQRRHMVTSPWGQKPKTEYEKEETSLVLYVYSYYMNISHTIATKGPLGRVVVSRAQTLDK